MKDLIKQYHGAKIFEVTQIEPLQGTPLLHKVMAKAVLPGIENLYIDFVEEAPNLEQAVDQIQQDIDQYLSDHHITEFISK